MDDFCGSEFWNTEKVWNSPTPELTICFQKTVLIWIPCAFLWIFIPIEISFIRNSSYRNIPWGFLNITKLIVTILLIILSIIELILPFTGGEIILPVDYSGSVIKIITFITSTILVFFNKKNGQQSSGILFMFWLIFGICNIPQGISIIFQQKYERFENLTEFNFKIETITFIGIWLMIILNFFADNEPIESLYPKPEKPCPESSSSFISKVFFAWFDSIIWKGYKKQLDFDDFWNLTANYQCKTAYGKFLNYWNEMGNLMALKKPKLNKNSKTTSTNISLLSILWKRHGTTIFIGFIFRLINDLLIVVTPQMLKLILQYIEETDNNLKPLWKGLILAIGIFLLGVLQGLFAEKSGYISNNLNIRIRSELISAIYRKVLKLSNTARQNSSAGQITSLYSVDVQRLCEISFYIMLLFASFISLIIGVYSLWNVLGVSVLAGLVLIVIFSCLNTFIGKKMKIAEAQLMKVKDLRIKIVNNIMQGMKILKLQAWEESFEKKANEARSNELKFLKKVIYLELYSLTLGYILRPMITFTFLATYASIDERNILNAEIVFVSITLINVITEKFYMLPMSFYRIIQASVSLDRVNKFLNSEELDDENVLNDPTVKSALLIQNGNFSWETNKLFLQNINLNVEAGKLVAIVGVIGSGKSSLLSALLGEMIKISGHVNVIGNIGYVSQQCWIRNCTLRENILFGKEMNKEFYNKIVKACALDLDISLLSAGDLTEIGEKGINLSGGQKQRIALARSIYNNSDIYLFDDPLSAVDSHVGKHIFENVIGPNGLLAGKTRIIVTHGINFLPQVDHIYVLKDGMITESGCYESLLNAGGVFADLLTEYSQESDQMKNESIDNFKHRKLSDSIIHKRRTSSNSIKQNVDIDKEDRLIEEEIMELGNIKWKAFQFYIKYLGIGIIFSALLCIFVSRIFKIFTFSLLSVWSNNSTTNSDKGIQNTFFGIYAGSLIMEGLLAILFLIFLRFGSLKVSNKMHLSLLSSILRVSLTFFDVTPIGRILQRFTTDIEFVDRTLPQSVVDFLVLTFDSLAVFVLITISTYEFIYAIVPLVIIYFLMQRFFTKTARQLKRLESITRSPIFSILDETIQGVHIIRAYNAQERFIAEAEKRLDFHQKFVFARNISLRWLGVRVQLLASTIVLFSALFVILSQDTIGAGWAGTSISNALSITYYFNWLLRMSSELEMGLVTIERIKEYSELTSEPLKELSPKTLPKNWPEVGAIEMKNVQCRYRPGLELVLKGLSVKINGGEKVGVVGRTGAGKSSLSLALFRIIEADNGTIMIDGEDISKLGLHTLRSKMTIIPQDPVLFTGTLRMNLDPFNVKSDDELWTVLEQVNLKDFVQSLKDGLYFDVNDDGDNLSVGQKQLFCLVRALLRNSKIIILDEATAAVDLETDELIQYTIRSSFHNCTILTIAHRLNTIMDSDRIMVLDNGSVAEFDSPKQLLENKNSIFCKMAKESRLI